ncbi:hypothetical protein L1987_55098 [Smallanthus sonchifolius]|uniref:Uncharacterized protein n=1 Tax=Smallanthus sonchifolius TaxID=185202 RepID=A0ACB9E920_9ASTR|nr:hypothetical protein L1987_55098 [Smallanthus sonchifolius]
MVDRGLGHKKKSPVVSSIGGWCLASGTGIVVDGENRGDTVMLRTCSGGEGSICDNDGYGSGRVSVISYWFVFVKIVSDISDAQQPAKCISETAHQIAKRERTCQGVKTARHKTDILLCDYVFSDNCFLYMLKTSAVYVIK